MRHLFFVGSVFCWLSLAAFFAMRWAYNRVPTSLVIIAACVGWPVAVYGELYGFPEWVRTYLGAAALVLGALGFVVVFHGLSQRYGVKGRVKP